MLTIDNFIGKQEDWAAYITNVEMMLTPFLDWLPEGSKPVNPRFDYQAERFRNPRRNAHVDGKPWSEPYSAGDSRAQLSALIQWLDTGTSVSLLSQDVTNNKAIPDELSHDVPKMMKEMSRDAEANFLDDNDQQVGDKVNPYMCRSVGNWLGITAQTVLPVDSNFAVPAASRDTTPWSSQTEDNVRNVAQSIWEESNADENVTVFCGSTAAMGMGDFQYRLPGSTKAAPVVNATLQRTFKDKTLSRAVRHIEGDFFDLDIMPTRFLSYFTNAGATANAVAARRGRAYFLHQSRWEVRWNQQPKAFVPPFAGGSYETFAYMILMLVCKNPRAEGALAPTTP